MKYFETYISTHLFIYTEHIYACDAPVAYVWMELFAYKHVQHDTDTTKYEILEICLPWEPFSQTAFYLELQNG